MIFDKNITTDSTVDLIPIGSNAGNIESIYISNRANNHVLINVYFEDASGTTFYLIRKVNIPYGAALVLTDNVAFNNNIFKLKIVVLAVSGTPIVDVLIR